MQGQRTIILEKNFMKRFDKDTMALLKSEFERVQEAGVGTDDYFAIYDFN